MAIEDKSSQAAQDNQPQEKINLMYTVDETPPWYLCILLGFQQFLTCFGATFGYPIIISTYVCLSNDLVGLGEVTSTVIFTSGLSTLLQSTLGIRLPIVQSVSYVFVTPVIVLMYSTTRKCPYVAANATITYEQLEETRTVWKANMAEIQGCLMVASAVQIVIGFSGIIGFLMRFIGPLTIAPTITLIGLSLAPVASMRASEQWWICVMTIVLIVLFSQYLRNLELRLPCFKGGLQFFALFPVLLGIVISWLICLILTVTDTLPNDKEKWGYKARTDIKLDALRDSEWFRFPYPGQWGVPSLTIGGVLGMVAASIASMIESVGDYFACARLAGAPPPTGSAVSRGIGMEGITSFLAGAWGAGGGNTSYSECIGAIGITKVGSRTVIQTAGIIMVLLGCLGKFGALFVTLPDPIVGALFFVMFAMVTAVGISNLQFVDLNSTRNLFVFGFAIFFGISFPNWIRNNQFDTGDGTADNVLNVMCGTNMFVGGIVAFLLDNTIPGTRKERGFLGWKKSGSTASAGLSTYDLPLVQRYLDTKQWPRYVPFCPRFVGNKTPSSDPEGIAVSNHDVDTMIDNRQKDASHAAYNETFVPDKLETQL